MTTNDESRRTRWTPAGAGSTRSGCRASRAPRLPRGVRARAARRADVRRGRRRCTSTPAGPRPRDDLAHTLDYGALAEQVAAVLSGRARSTSSRRSPSGSPRPSSRTGGRAGRRRRRAQAAGADPRCRSATSSSRSTATASKLPGRRAVRPAPGGRGGAGLPAGPHVDRAVPGHPGARRARGRGGRPGARSRGPTPSAPAPGCPRRRARTAPSTELEPVPPEPPSSTASWSRTSLDQAPAGPVDVVLALGANLGAAQETLRDAVADLAADPGRRGRRRSRRSRAPSAVGGPSSPTTSTRSSWPARRWRPRDAAAGDAGGRAARTGASGSERWGPRTLDIDIVVYGSALAVTDDLELPHPRAHERAFVLAAVGAGRPRTRCCPGLGGGPVGALAATAPDRDGIRWLALDWLTTAIPAVGSDTAAVPPAPDPAARSPGRADAPHPLADAPARSPSPAPPSRGSCCGAVAGRGGMPPPVPWLVVAVEVLIAGGRVLHGLGRPAVPARQAADAGPDPRRADGGAREGVLLHRCAARRLVRRPGAGAGRRPERRPATAAARSRRRARGGAAPWCSRSSGSSSSGSAGSRRPRTGDRGGARAPRA